MSPYSLKSLARSPKPGSGRNPKQAKEASDRWRQKDRTCGHLLLTQARDRARKQGWTFELTEAWLFEHLHPMLCEETDHRLSWPTKPLGRGYKHPWTPSIDRRDCTKGYTIDNCRVVSTIYNMAKSTWTDEVVAQFRGNGPNG